MKQATPPLLFNQYGDPDKGKQEHGKPISGGYELK